MQILISTLYLHIYKKNMILCYYLIHEQTLDYFILNVFKLLISTLSKNNKIFRFKIYFYVISSLKKLSLNKLKRISLKN